VAQSPILLFNRACVVTVGTVQVSNIGLGIGLDVWFHIKRSLKPKEPNTCDLRLYNLAPSTRDAIAQSAQVAPSYAQPALVKGAQPLKIVSVQIDAGYVGNMETIFLGEMRSAQTTVSGPDEITELQSGDADQAMLLARSTTHLGKGASNAYNVATQLLADMGCKGGNIATVAAVLKAAPLYPNGVTLKGCSHDLLCDLARSCALEVTIQNKIAQWTSLGQPLGGEAYSVGSDTGLIGSPTVDTKGVLSLEMLMAPGIAPGKPIVMNGKYIKGLYRIFAVTTLGDTNGREWSHKIEAKRYGEALSKKKGKK
jgi:hypothetical protein